MKKRKKLEKIQSNLFQDLHINNIHGGAGIPYIWVNSYIYVKGLTFAYDKQKVFIGYPAI